ncbi:MAG: hypothetical protein JWN03_440 [Nocardia sp.]|uniref:hypothetical protein n=1 Tax=Nocardia sp. TaxID=1821 RepID=UPI00261F894A|nr:hypothetical protein [Nocardia sp.]MCU1640165.1 hypothetical protein [Nocardia sp.]
MTPQTRSLRIGFAAFVLATALATAGQAAAEITPQPVGASETYSGSAATGSSFFLNRLVTYLTSGSSSCPPWAIACAPL